MFHEGASTLCRATGGPQRPADVPHLPQALHAHTLEICTLLKKKQHCSVCALFPDCPATAAASAAATQNQPPAATNPGEARLCVCA